MREPEIIAYDSDVFVVPADTDWGYFGSDFDPGAPNVQRLFGIVTIDTPLVLTVGAKISCANGSLPGGDVLKLGQSELVIARLGGASALGALSAGQVRTGARDSVKMRGGSVKQLESELGGATGGGST